MALAFLGDAVLALVVAEYLCAGGAGRSRSGVLTTRRAELVSGDDAGALGERASSWGRCCGSGAGRSRRGDARRSRCWPRRSRRCSASSTWKAGLDAVRRVVGGLPLVCRMWEHRARLNSCACGRCACCRCACGRPLAVAAVLPAAFGDLLLSEERLRHHRRGGDGRPGAADPRAVLILFARRSPHASRPGALDRC